MKRVTLTLCSAAVLAAFGGCATYEPVTPVGAVVTAPGAVVTAPAAGTVVTTTQAPGMVVMTPAPVVTSQPMAVQSAPGTTVVQSGTAVVLPSAAGVRPGSGRIDSSTRLTQASGLAYPMRRYGARMDDGTVQFFDSQASNLEIGDRIELTADNHVRYGFLR